ncbi:hypothetical protein Dimus_017259 [Dionaea muscipula]
MGNCQAAEAATVVVMHSGNKVERIYWSVSAHDIMIANPGNYVAAIVASSAASMSKSCADGGAPARQLRLLRPDDTLLVGHVYRLISFEDVLKGFASKKSVKLGKSIEASAVVSAAGKKSKKRRSSGHGGDPIAVAASVAGGRSVTNPESDNSASAETEPMITGLGTGSGAGYMAAGLGRHHGSGGGQWKPALQSIAELGS